MYFTYHDNNRIACVGNHNPHCFVPWRPLHYLGSSRKGCTGNHIPLN